MLEGQKPPSYHYIINLNFEKVPWNRTELVKKKPTDEGREL